MRIPTHHKPSAGMPGPERSAHTGWLGVVTGIRLMHIIAAATAERHGGFLVKFNSTIMGKAKFRQFDLRGSKSPEGISSINKM